MEIDALNKIYWIG